MNAKELWRYLDALNAKNDFDLAWKWTGEDDTPIVKVYEQADRHELCSGTMDEIKENIQKALPHWGLDDIEES